MQKNETNEITISEDDLVVRREIFGDRENFKRWFISTYYQNFNEIPDVTTMDVIKSIRKRRNNIEKYFASVVNCVSKVLYNEDFSNMIFEKTRKGEVVLIRKMSSYIMVKKLKFSLCSVAKVMGKNHATIIHHCKSMQDILEVDFDLKKKFKLIEIMLIEEGIII